MSKVPVQSLWIGQRLSTMERLSILSYLEQGHPFHLYVYGPVTNIPDGTLVRNGQEILPAEEIFCYQHGYGKGSFAAFANCFRYKLLCDRGGWWSDLDIVCLNPLDFPAEHVVGHERRPHEAPQVNNALISGPLPVRSCAIALRLVGKWIDRRCAGARLVRRCCKAMEVLAVPVQVLEPSAFYPINYWQVWDLIQRQELPTDGWAVHLWHSKWQHQGLNPDHIYSTRCIYEQLKRKFNVRSPINAAAGPGWISSGRYHWRQLKTRWRVANWQGRRIKRDA